VSDKIARAPDMIEVLIRAHATARAHVSKQTGAPARVTIDLDGTLPTSHSEPG